MITLYGQKYELFFSNKLAPRTALNYADELFFKEFEKLCGKRYRILSIIRQGWQKKYGLLEDIQQLTKHLESKSLEDEWPHTLLQTYEARSEKLRNLLDEILQHGPTKLDHRELISNIRKVRSLSALLDAMSNMLHLFSSLVGHTFYARLRAYGKNAATINENFIFYTQPINESRFAKIIMPDIKNPITLSRQDATLSTILRVGSFVKDDVSALLDMRISSLNKCCAEIARRLRCDVEDLDYLQIDEIEQHLAKNIDPKPLVKKRRDITVLFYQDAVLKVYEGEGAERFLRDGNLTEIPSHASTSILRGQTASLGTAQGHVVVASTSNEAIKKMKDGDVLVAQYTAVEYLPAMRKASAIITETGGITSHAAIVSRELKIPCVIGVKDAMKILKDGQIVTVNADEGTITLTT